MLSVSSKDAGGKLKVEGIDPRNNFKWVWPMFFW